MWKKKNNILGQTSVTIDSYQKQGEVAPYYAEKTTRCLKSCRPLSTVT